MRASSKTSNRVRAEALRRKFSGARVERSSFFKSARARAADYIRNPGKLNRLLDQASQKIYRRQGPFSEIRDSLKTIFRLLRAYADGSYRQIPTASLVSIVAWVIYFVMPVDSIPDFIVSLGLLDDVALLGWLLTSVRADLDRFVEWEAQAPGERGESLTGTRSGED